MKDMSALVCTPRSRQQIFMLFVFLSSFSRKPGLICLLLDKSTRTNRKTCWLYTRTSVSIRTSVACSLLLRDSCHICSILSLSNAPECFFVSRNVTAGLSCLRLTSCPGIDVSGRSGLFPLQQKPKASAINTDEKVTCLSAGEKPQVEQPFVLKSNFCVSFPAVENLVSLHVGHAVSIVQHKSLSKGSDVVSRRERIISVAVQLINFCLQTPPTLCFCTSLH